MVEKTIFEYKGFSEKYQMATIKSMTYFPDIPVLM